jgi:hypothetical protein
MNPWPFPGMNPYLETGDDWESIHNWFIRELARLHTPAVLAMDCDIEVDRRVYRRDGDGNIVLVGKPDDLLAAQGDVPHEGRAYAGNGRTTGRKGESGVAMLAPAAVHSMIWDYDDLPAEEFLVIREGGESRRVLAVIELLSPGNKDASQCGLRYREKVEEYTRSLSNFMEIDLLRVGRNPHRERFPELQPSPYFVYVQRKYRGDWREEAYPVGLRDRLPVVPLPLAYGYPDLPLDLGAAWDATMQVCWRPAWKTRWAGPPPGPLDAADRDWVAREMDAWRQQSETTGPN